MFEWLAQPGPRKTGAFAKAGPRALGGAGLAPRIPLPGHLVAVAGVLREHQCGQKAGEAMGNSLCWGPGGVAGFVGPAWAGGALEWAGAQHGGAGEGEVTTLPQSLQRDSKRYCLKPLTLGRFCVAAATGDSESFWGARGQLSEAPGWCWLELCPAANPRTRDGSHEEPLAGPTHRWGPLR